MVVVVAVVVVFVVVVLMFLLVAVPNQLIARRFSRFLSVGAFQSWWSWWCLLSSC